MNRINTLRSFLYPTAVVLAVCIACMRLPHGIRAEHTSELEQTLTSIVQTQAKAWNEGDIPKFMGAYWNDEGLTFSSGGETKRGWKATRDGYLARYPDRKTMGTLEFSNLEVQSLGDNAALMLGVWKLERDNPVSGNFTLIWRRIGKEWLIIHDHSSAKR